MGDEKMYLGGKAVHEIDFDPHEHRDVKRPSNNIEISLNLIKGLFGTGILAMPQAFMMVGLINGAVSTMIIGFICLWCMHILFAAEYRCCKIARVGLLDYPKAMEQAFLVGPPKLRRCSKVSGYIVDAFMIMMQMGAGCVYYLFVAANVKKFAEAFGCAEYSEPLWMTFFLPSFIAIICIPDLKMLAPFSSLAIVSTFLSFGLVCYNMAIDLPPIRYHLMFQINVDYPLFFGTVLFAINSICVIVSLEANAKYPKDFLATFGVLNIGITFTATIYACLGFWGYWRYGSATEDSITLNLSGISGQVAIFLYATAIYISYSLQCFVSNQVMWQNYLIKLFPNTGKKKLLLYEYIFRIISVIVTYGLAAGIPLLGLFISLIGALCMSTIGLILPMVMDLCVRYPDDYGVGKIVLIRDFLLLFIGLFAMIFGSYMAVRDIVITLMK